MSEAATPAQAGAVADERGEPEHSEPEEGHDAAPGEGARPSATHLPAPFAAGDDAETRIWSLIVPVKPAAVGKSRLIVPGVDREALARAIALDTLEAAARAARVAELVVVTDDADVRATLHRCRTPGRGTHDHPSRTKSDLDGVGAHVRFVTDPGRGLNAAITLGLETAIAPLRAAMLGDLPALRPADLDNALAHASGRRGYRSPGTDGPAIVRRRLAPLAVADADGTGTTLLAHARSDALRFGKDSYSRHLAAGAAPLDLATRSTLRQDVDTAAHLSAARALGLGPRTAALLG